jgi:hypothetical protein|tara:strand:- start:330 stop:524 length:195 start_codon:yes stop_codon:yes gene_type:complete
MNDFVGFLNGLDWGSIVSAALQLVGAFSVIATMTSNTSDNAIADFLLRVVNTLGANVGNAKNAE